MFGLSHRGSRAAGLVSALVLALALVLGPVACGEDPATDDTASTGLTVLGESVTSNVATEAETTTTEAETASTETTGSAEGSIVGTWHSDQTGETHQYTADGRLIVTSGGGMVTEMTYTADGSNISYLIGGAVVYTGTYSVDGDVLSQVDPRVEGTVYFDRVE